MQPPNQHLKIEYLKYLKELIKLDEQQIPVTLEEKPKHDVIDYGLLTCLIMAVGVACYLCGVGREIPTYLPTLIGAFMTALGFKKAVS